MMMRLLSTRLPCYRLVSLHSVYPLSAFYHVRHFSTDSNDTQHRHEGIQMHPDSISSTILPGNYVMYTRKGETRKRTTELTHGYFWNIKDLKRCNNKPILSSAIPESMAKPFPTLWNCKSLSGTVVDLPDYFLRKNRSRDPKAQCTLVAISFRDFGYQLLPSWLGPFQEALPDENRVEVFRLNISEGWFNKWILRGLVQGMMKKNTPAYEHNNTLLYFGNVDRFQDALRMHNVLTSYVYLLDGIGRVRFAGSGSATDEEIRQLVAMAKQLSPLISNKKSTKKLTHT